MRGLFSFLLFFALSPSLSAQRILDTIAGGVIRSGVPANDIMVGSGQGIARDPSGNIVFSDMGGTVIRRINQATGMIETIAGTGQPGVTGDGGPALQARINATWMTYDAAGNLYFADFNRIRKLSTDGIINTVAGTGLFSSDGPQGQDGPPTSAQIGGISGIAFDSQGNLYFTELQGFVRRLTPSGRLGAGTIEKIAGTGASLSTVIEGDGGPAEEAGLYRPTGIAIDPDGNIYFSQEGLTSQNQVKGIRKITPDGIIHRFAGFGNTYPPADGTPLPVDQARLQTGPLGIDSHGDLLLYNGVLIRIHGGTAAQIADGKGTPVGGAILPSDLRYNEGPALQTPLFGNSGMVIAPNDEVFLRATYRIRKLANGQISTIAGSNPQAAPDSTPAKQSWITNPVALALGPDGSMYFSEMYGCRIRKIDPQSNLATVAGTGKCADTGTLPRGMAMSTDFPIIYSLAADNRGRVYFADNDGLSYISPSGEIVPIPETGPAGASLGVSKILIDSKNKVNFVYLGSQQYQSTWYEISADDVVTPLYQVNKPGARITILTAVLDANDNFYPCVFVQALQSCRFSSPLPLNVSVIVPGDQTAIDPAQRIWTLYTTTLSEITIDYALGLPGPSADGVPFRSTSISDAGQLAINHQGEMFVTDTANFRIRRISAEQPKPKPSFTAAGVVNGASLVGGAISPGELITVFGSNLAPEGLNFAPVENNEFAASAAGTAVYFGGAVGRIWVATPTQINVFVPEDWTNSSASITVVNDGVSSDPVVVPVVRSIFGLVSIDSSGSGQGAILNQDNTVNSATNAAPRGSVVTLFGTGEGTVSPAVPTGGAVLSTPYPKSPDPVTVTIGGQNAEVLYAGSAPTLAVGVFQINVRIPANIDPGNAPIAVKIGEIATTKTITVTVK